MAVQGEGDLDWGALDGIAEPLARLLNRSQIAADLALTVLKLRTAGVTVAEGPRHGDIAAACNVAEDDVIQTARRLDTAFAPVLERLQPVIAHFAGLDAARPFDPDGDGIHSDEEVLTALSTLAADLPEPPLALLTRARNSATHDELRRALYISLTAYNTTLSALGGRYRPLDYTHQHREEFQLLVASRWPLLSQRLRWARLPGFTAHDVGDDWAVLRNRTSITADPTWGTTLDALDEDTMLTRIETELRRLLGHEAPNHGPDLPPLENVRRTNIELIDKLTEPMTVAVRAWLVRNGHQVMPPWNTSAEAGTHLRDQLDRAGALDFLPLDPQTLVLWLQAMRLWPEGMPGTFNLEDLQLDDADIDAQRSEAEQERLARQRARRSIEIDDVPYDTDKGLGQLRVALAASLDAAPAFTAGAPRFTRLVEMSQSSRSSLGGGAGGGRSYRAEQLSDQQRNAIGFAGEWLVYQWLKATYPNISEECWRSSYRSVEFPGEGDDTLGYDFLIPARGGDLMFEVKATKGPAGQIQLGESEVRQAQANARNRRWRLVVVEHALTSQRRRLVLPNPFSPDSRALYAFVGQGLRLRFTLA
jgi:hypothetical protein